VEKHHREQQDEQYQENRAKNWVRAAALEDGPKPDHKRGTLHAEDDWREQ
jgi:hypothetical protein